jgi:hypothetical protein
MTPHKFKPGQFVRVITRHALGAPEGRYEIVRTLPPRDSDNDNQYRVRNVDDNQERVVRESELS